MKKLALVFALISAVALTAMAWPTNAAGTITLKIATLAPKGTTLVTALEKASDEIQQRTDGRVKLRVYPGGVMGNDATVMRKTRTGQLHGSSFTAGGVRTTDPDYQILSMPLLFRGYEEVDAIRAKYEDRLTAQLEQKGMVSFGIMEAGFGYMMSTKPIRTLDDLQDRKVWVPEGDLVGERVFRKLGVPPVYKPLGDVLTGLQTGLLDTVTNSPVGAVVLQWFTKVKYFVDTPLLYTYGTIAFPTAAFNKVGEADRPVVREVLAAMSKDIDRQNREANGKALQTLKNEGLEFVPINDSELPRMEKLADDALGELVGEGKINGKLLAEIRATINAMR